MVNHWLPMPRGAILKDDQCLTVLRYLQSLTLILFIIFILFKMITIIVIFYACLFSSLE